MVSIYTLQAKTKEYTLKAQTEKMLHSKMEKEDGALKNDAETMDYFATKQIAAQSALAIMACLSMALIPEKSAP